jgi:hypothetical protein
VQIAEIPEDQRAGLYRTLLRAKFRAFSEDQLLDYVKCARPPEHIAIEELSERKLSPKGHGAIRHVICALAAAGEAAPSTDRAKYDLRIKHLLSLAPPEEAIELALRDVTHPRKTRRKAALQLLRHQPLGGGPLTRLVKAFADSPSATLASVLAHHAEKLDSQLLPIVLGECEADFDRTLVIEAMLRRDDLPPGITSQHAFEFIWAAGRSGRNDLLPAIHELIETADPDERIFSIYLWCLGRLGDLSAVLRIEGQFLRAERLSGRTMAPRNTGVMLEVNPE